ncbi:class I SAM-dependent methyltransferase [Listeria kieliensis]|uniref:16S rRNA methyltransferase n=1 Tax=Listeria kieliensis TaxID=1621700 RepID=A0A3D8TQV8_9LIST|nr:class I SAM-dependent methyltransferase [Listeria kieliensis]RDX01077.1 16S rRNA methyltransferase [Listeria kieliensis]
MTNNHYFTNDQNLSSNRQTFNYQLRGFNLQFISDEGVFSKKTVDFGSRLLIETFEFPELAGKVLDVGCGYGPIGLGLAKDFPDREIEMVDVNLRALALAKENAALNDVQNVQIYESSVYDRVEAKNFTAIVSNPPIRAGKVVVHAILEGAYERLAPSGELWIVIQKKQGGPSAAHKMEQTFGNVEVVKKDKGYYIYRSVKA